jgi:hypothetical protein
MTYITYDDSQLAHVFQAARGQICLLLMINPTIGDIKRALSWRHKQNQISTSHLDVIVLTIVPEIHAFDPLDLVTVLLDKIGVFQWNKVNQITLSNSWQKMSIRTMQAPRALLFKAAAVCFLAKGGTHLRIQGLKGTPYVQCSIGQEATRHWEAFDKSILMSVISNNPDAKGLSWANDQGLNTQVVNHKDFLSQTEKLNTVEKIFENYNIDKLDIKRIYRYLDKNVKKDIVCEEESDIDE